MRKFFGKVGYGVTEQANRGVYVDKIVEREYYGDVTRISRLLKQGENLHMDVQASNAISILADAYANENFHKIKFVVWNGVAWTVDNVEVQAPRLILRIGEVYNGSRA